MLFAAGHQTHSVCKCVNPAVHSVLPWTRNVIKDIIHQDSACAIFLLACYNNNKIIKDIMYQDSAVFLKGLLPKNVSKILYTKIVQSFLWPATKKWGQISLEYNWLYCPFLLHWQQPECYINYKVLLERRVTKAELFCAVFTFGWELCYLGMYLWCYCTHLG